MILVSLFPRLYAWFIVSFGDNAQETDIKE